MNTLELDHLAQRYARELKTHPKDVLDRLHELLDQSSTQSEEQVCFLYFTLLMLIATVLVDNTLT